LLSLDVNWPDVTTAATRHAEKRCIRLLPFGISNRDADHIIGLKRFSWVKTAFNRRRLNSHPRAVAFSTNNRHRLFRVYVIRPCAHAFDALNIGQPFDERDESLIGHTLNSES
jgi:hypothetical protein